jgi:hypothetical protein
MNCREYKGGLIELARGGEAFEAERHAESCPDCARFLDQQLVLTELQRTIAVDAAPPVDLEARLITEFVLSRRRPRRWARVAAGAVAAGAIAASLFFAWFERPKPAPKPVTARIQFPAPVPVAQAAPKPEPVRQRKHPRGRQEAEAPFLQIPYTQALEPWERAEVVRMEMPVAALIAAGFPVETADTTAEASADVIVGEDGRARAVRLISISERSIRR